MGDLSVTRLAAGAALRSRRSIAGAELDALLAPPASLGTPLLRDADQRRAVLRALGFLALLSRVRGGGWRNSCLFRAVTECLVLRGAGRPAVIRLGVARGETDDIEAHAWAECPGVHCLTATGGEGARYAPLRFG